METQLLSTVSTLTQLRSLNLSLLVNPHACTPDSVRPHATCLACLGALTALTSLHLSLQAGRKVYGDSWKEQTEAGAEHVAWAEVTEVQRSSLLSALRCMPQLQDLSCAKLWLRLYEVTPLTALTRLTLGGLLPPHVAPTGDGAASAVAAATSAAAASVGAGASASGGSLPPQLRAFDLWEAIAPSALAALQPPTSMTKLHVSCIRFGMSDVSPDCRVLPKAVRDFGLAARRLAPFLLPEYWHDLTVAADCGDRPMGPPEAGAQSHTGWIRQMDVLSALTHLRFQGVRLYVGDLACLVATLPDLEASTVSHTGVAHAVLRASAVLPWNAQWRSVASEVLSVLHQDKCRAGSLSWDGVAGRLVQPSTLHASDSCMLPCLNLLLPLQGLTLMDTHVSPGALHVLTGLQLLAVLTLDLKHCTHLTTDDLAATLCLLCRGIRALTEVTVMTKSELLDADACVDTVVEQLEAWEVAAPRIEIYPEAGM